MCPAALFVQGKRRAADAAEESPLPCALAGGLPLGDCFDLVLELAQLSRMLMYLLVHLLSCVGTYITCATTVVVLSPCFRFRSHGEKIITLRPPASANAVYDSHGLVHDTTVETTHYRPTSSPSVPRVKNTMPHHTNMYVACFVFPVTVVVHGSSAVKRMTA